MKKTIAHLQSILDTGRMCQNCNDLIESDLGMSKSLETHSQCSSSDNLESTKGSFQSTKDSRLGKRNKR